MTTPLIYPTEGPLLDAHGMIGDAWGAETDTVVVPVERLDPGFFTLSNGVAGEILQKFVNYHIRLVLIGDMAGHGTAFSDLVRESNRGTQAWFLPTLDDLDARLG
ncbi:DUF4180 domain-containing protein [Actinoplanes sp. NPDC051494]|uniref:DUF4180 domain-containing protein n=1 Tax=Actinoplanes sp. NPDC051494 TaxID=3363907 RepID=UPI0037A5DDF1